MMKKEGPENLTLTGHDEDKGSKESQQVNYLTRLYEWISEKRKNKGR